jgi:RHS repeat-associated protein
VSDHLLGRDASSITSATNVWYESRVLSYADYLPFGATMTGRSGSTVGYRFGFNGKEKDEAGEFGSLTHYDYGFRIYSPVIAKFLSVDPLSPSYPWYTPYQFAGNSPITFIDQDGLERVYAADGTFIHQYGWNIFNRKVVSNMDLANQIRRNPGAFADHLENSKIFKPAKLFDGSETIQEAAIGATIMGASSYYLKYNKTRNSGYLEAASLLFDFATGEGPYLRKYKFEDPFFQLLNTDNKLLAEVVSDFEKELAKNNTDAKSYFGNFSKFKGGYEFSPDHGFENDGFSGLKESIDQHIEAIKENPIEFVIGGMSYKMWPTNRKDLGQGYEIEFVNVSGKNSLLLHLATDIDNVATERPYGLMNKKQRFRGHMTAEQYEQIKRQLNENR